VAYHLPDLTADERERLRANVVFNPALPFGCWGWTGAVSTRGYAEFWCQGHHWRAYKLIFREIYGVDHPDQVFHHGCGNGPLACVNPHCTVPIDRARNVHMLDDPERFEWESRPFLRRIRDQAKAFRLSA
jgi:hypothetical protein